MNWYSISPRAQTGSSSTRRTRLPNSIFGYDFNTGKRARFRSYQRRSQSCPGSWKNIHPCPETSQRDVMRNDGVWWHKDLEPGTSINQIRNHRVGAITTLSKMRYTCDEFPPATWVEGGGDRSDPNVASQTRCAAMSCARGCKAEQNWQADAHGKLQRQLKSIIEK